MFISGLQLLDLERESRGLYKHIYGGNFFLIPLILLPNNIVYHQVVYNIVLLNIVFNGDHSNLHYYDA